MKAIIGKNIKSFREISRFSQEQVSDFLNINRSTYSNYELGEREAPIDVLEKCADLFGCELSSFFVENDTERRNMLSCAFRIDNLASEDLVQIAEFKAIVKNYLKMNLLLESK